MASSQNQRYNERLAARLRGAGTHKIQNYGFAIQPPAAPPPLPPPPVAPPEPKPVAPPEVPVRRSPRVTPTPPPRSSQERRTTGPSSLRNEASASDEAETPPVSTSRRISTRASSSSSSAKTPTHATASRASTRSASIRPAVAAVTPVTRGKRTRQPSPDKFLTTPETAGIAARNGRSSSLLRAGASESGGSIVAEKSPEGNKRRKVIKVSEAAAAVAAVEPEVGSEDEVDASESRQSSVERTAVEDEGRSRRLREMPIGKPQTRQSARKSESPLFLGDPDDSDDGAEQEEEPTPRPQPKRKVLGKVSAPPPPPLEDEEEVDEHLQEPTPRPQPKRKVLGKVPAPPPPMDEEEEEVDEHLLEATPESDDRDFEGQEEQEEQDDEEQSPQLTKKRSRPTNTARHKPKSRSRARGEGEDEGPSTFPVAVYRLGKAQGSTLPAGSQRSGVNPVDVISQVATEIIDKFYQRLKSSSEKNAVESYKEELSLRFLELTDAFEHGIALTSQVRQAQRRKKELMTELLAIKRERAQVAAKMDDVRKEHEIASKISGGQQETSQAFEEISGALERAKLRTGEDDGSMEGLEALVRKVSGLVTGGGSDGTGLLGRVVEFNSFLERTEKALRERNSAR